MQKIMLEHKEVIYNDLAKSFEPVDNISDKYYLDKWCAIPYETDTYSGTMLVSHAKGCPEDIKLCPNLEGWYKIFICISANFQAPSVLNIKLSSDVAFSEICLSRKRDWREWDKQIVEESMWKCANMTGEELTITKKKQALSTHSALVWVKFVPMSDEEIDLYNVMYAKKEDKRLYAADDMNHILVSKKLEGIEDWMQVVEPYKNSDIEWLSLEEVRPYSEGECSTGDINLFSFFNDGAKNVQKQLSKYYTDEMLCYLIDAGHKQGLKMSMAMRMGIWGMDYPFDQYFYDNKFRKENSQFCCVDRNGDAMEQLSYAFPEVQDYIISNFARMAKTGCDAVTLIFHRGIPYFLFEAPVVERFYKRYGEIPYELPLDEPRLNQIHCEFMTEFMRKLRKELNEKFGIGKIEIHVRVMFSLYDSQYVGLDVVKWAKEGLINTIISYPQRVYEKLEGDVWKEDDYNRIDISKYTEYVRSAKIDPIEHIPDFISSYKVKDSRGHLQGPDNLKERVAEFMTLEKQYGVKIYFDIMPRNMETIEFQKNVLELYNAGAERVALWDTYGRVARSAMWSMVRRLGHKEELANYSSGEGEFYNYYRLLKVAGKDVSRYKVTWGG